jgi:hypothetical protein
MIARVSDGMASGHVRTLMYIWMYMITRRVTRTFKQLGKPWLGGRDDVRTLALSMIGGGE